MDTRDMARLNLCMVMDRRTETILACVGESKTRFAYRTTPLVRDHAIAFKVYREGERSIEALVKGDWNTVLESEVYISTLLVMFANPVLHDAVIPPRAPFGSAVYTSSLEMARSQNIFATQVLRLVLKCQGYPQTVSIPGLS